MPHTNTRSRKPMAAAVASLLLACIGLAACGGSSTSSSSSASATAAGSGTSSTGTSSTGTSSTGSTSTTPVTGHASARFAAMRECLQKNGITLPKRTPGSARPAGGAGLAGGGAGPSLPKGVTRAQYEAALKKCGGGARFAGGGARFANNPVFKAALGKYAACLRQNGIDVPGPNTSGNGPIFDTKGINTTSPQFRNASKKCRSTLIGAFKRPAGAPGASGASGAGGAPPAGGGGSASGGTQGGEG
jgi:hypothetical protein